MFWSKPNTVYRKVYKKITEDVGRLRVKLFLEKGGMAFLELSGELVPTLKESNPLDSRYEVVAYTVTSAEDILQNLLSSNPDWIVDESGNYIHTKINQILKVEIVENKVNNQTKDVYIGVETYTGEESE